jgi:hypothetical protein
MPDLDVVAAIMPIIELLITYLASPRWITRSRFTFPGPQVQQLVDSRSVREVLRAEVSSGNAMRSLDVLSHAVSAVESAVYFMFL